MKDYSYEAEGEQEQKLWHILCIESHRQYNSRLRHIRIPYVSGFVAAQNMPDGLNKKTIQLELCSHNIGMLLVGWRVGDSLCDHFLTEEPLHCRVVRMDLIW